MGGGHVVGESGTNGDFDTLKGIHDEEPQRTVEHVEIEDVVKGCPISYLVLGPAFLEWDRVRREPVIADVA